MKLYSPGIPCQANSNIAAPHCLAGPKFHKPLHARWRTVQPARSAEDDVPQLDRDWREFRRSLLAQENPETAGRESEMNMELLRIQNPSLAAEGVWAHPTSTIEQGGVLLATMRAPEILMQDRMEQVVIFILSHKPEGSLGLILNRPSGQVLGKGRGGVRFPIANAPDRMQETFADSRVYVGGFTAQQIFHMMHPYDLPGSVKVLDGVHMGGISAAVDKVATGKLPPSSFKFFSGTVAWGPNQLEREITAGCWYTAACSRSLVLKPCLQLPTPLWREILLLMGGEFFEVAQDAYEGDEVSGE